VLGPFVCTLKLSGTLTFCLVVALALQAALGYVYGYVGSKAQDAKVSNDPKEAEKPIVRFNVFLHAMNLADAAGASLLAAMLQDLVVSEHERCKETDADHPVFLSTGRHLAAACRLLEDIPTLWFQISLLCLTLDSSHGFSLALNCLSIASSIVGLLFAFTSLAECAREHCKLGQLAKASVEMVFGLISLVVFLICSSGLLGSRCVQVTR